MSRSWISGTPASVRPLYGDTDASVSNEAFLLPESKGFREASTLWSPAPIGVPALLTAGGVTSVGEIQSDRLRIGQGYNPALAEQGSQAVVFQNDGAELEQVGVSTGGVAGQKIRYTFKQVRSLQQLKETFGLSAAASLGWGLFSVDVSTSFFRERSFSEYSNYLLIDIIVQNSTEVLKRSELTSTARNTANKNPSQFVRNYGYEYVYGRITGGRFTAIVRINSRTAAEQSKVDAAIEGSVSGYGSATLKISEAIQSLSEFKDTAVTIARDGGIGAVPSIAGVAAAAETFPSLVLPSENPVVFALLTRPYTTVEDPPADLPSPENIRNQQRVLGIIADYLDTAAQIEAGLRYILKCPSQFKGDTKTSATARLSQITKITMDLLDAAEEARGNLKVQVPAAPEFPELDYERVDAVDVTPPPPPPPPPPQWVRVNVDAYPFLRPEEVTLLGVVGAGEKKTVEFRGAFCPHIGVRGCYDAAGNPLTPSGIDVVIGKPASYACMIQLRRRDNGQVIETIQYKGYPVGIPRTDVEVRAYVDDNDPSQNRHCDPPLEGILYDS